MLIHFYIQYVYTHIQICAVHPHIDTCPKDTINNRLLCIPIHVNAFTHTYKLAC